MDTKAISGLRINRGPKETFCSLVIPQRGWQRVPSDKHLWQWPHRPPGSLGTVTELMVGCQPREDSRDSGEQGKQSEIALVAWFCGVCILPMTRSPNMIKSTVCGGFLIYFLHSNEMFYSGFLVLFFLLTLQ